jgi:hypothetical protein
VPSWYMYVLSVSVSYTMRPLRGLVIFVRCVLVRRGGRKPLVVLDTWSAALECGVVVPMPTFWAWMVVVASKHRQQVRVVIRIVSILNGK